LSITPLLTSILLAFAPSDLQDVGFQLLDPTGHAQTVSSLPSASSAPYILEYGQAALHEILSDAQIEATVTGRVKSLLSTHRKASRKGIAAYELHDRIALRVLVDEPDECYTVLDHLHARFAPVDGELDDYIASPKASGYQSLHTTVSILSDTLEVQIRTHDMHHAAEEGHAAHWRYKLLS
jgi:GTP pyrophosphokinase